MLKYFPIDRHYAIKLGSLTSQVFRDDSFQTLLFRKKDAMISRLERILIGSTKSTKSSFCFSELTAC